MVDEFLIGVDEAGRGPLAGPVAVGIVAVPLGFDVLREFPGVKDSKQLSGQKRELIFDAVERRVVAGDLRIRVRLSSNGYIDRFGITRAVRKALWSGVRELAEPHASVVMLDGLLHAPKEFSQRTFVRGDSRVPVISLASVVAKVTRDRLMEDISSEYPEYGFEQHKGYGTREHQLAIKRFGLTDLHRKSFCRGMKISLDLRT
jgi:ribonuclease HII